jgi:hypothetical protein
LNLEDRAEIIVVAGASLEESASGSPDLVRIGTRTGQKITRAKRSAELFPKGTTVTGRLDLGVAALRDLLLLRSFAQR